MLKPSTKSKVRFFYTDKGYHLKDSSGLRKFIEHIFILEGNELENLNYIFCSDQAILAINKKYLRHHYYTDIVTFDLSDKKGTIKGESYISIDRVRANASQLNISFRKELLRVVFHGALHLSGYSDKTKKAILVMREKEDHYLSLYLSR